MATITTDTFLDGGVARTAGEAWTLNNGAKLTVRTDHRVHANAPASNLGSLGSVTVNEGELIWDSTAIRWMPYNSGTGNVPPIGTTISQGAVSGYFLGIWASKTVLSTAAGAAMPATGFIKFREVTGGNFAAGALTGIGASAVGPDVQGWISHAYDAGANFTVPRLGKHTSRGGRFFLEDTNGSVGQIFQVPTEGSAVMYAPGLWIETGVGSNQYEYWPGLFSATNGWRHDHIGEAKGQSDVRQKFLKILAGGQLQMGEDFTQASTYISLAAQTTTYAGIANTGTYTWVNNIITVFFATGHLLEVGQQTGLDFTSGSGFDGIFTVLEVLSPYYFTVAATGSGTGGAVVIRPGATCTFTAHALNVGESVYLTVTTGTLPSGTYEIYAVTGANTYLIKYPHVAALTSGSSTALHTLTITFTAHLLAVGNKVYLDFTSGAGVDGVYTIKTVVDANNYRVNFPHSAAISSSNVTMRRQIGYVAPAGLRTWIPSNIVNECATGARATNTVPNATIASRPEWTTTSAGAIDLEYVYACSAYPNFSQAYAIRMRNCAFFDTFIAAETATPLDIEDTHTSMQGALDTVTLSLTSNFAGGLFKNCKFERGNTPGTSDHSAFIQYCKDLVFDNVQSGIIQYARSSGLPWSLAYCSGMEMNNCRTLNGNITLTACSDIEINDLDYCDRYNGRTNATSGLYAVSIGAGCADIKVDGITLGFNGAIEDCHPASGFVYYIGSQRIKVRNCGSYESKLSGGIWAVNAFGLTYVTNTGGNNNDVKIQRVYADKVKTAPFTNINSDKNVLYESVMGGMYVWSAKGILGIAHADLNGQVKGVQEINSVTGQPSVYGTHFIDLFMGTGLGRFILAMNEPTTETDAQFTMASGPEKWNSAGGILLASVGNQAIWEDNVFRKGHTGFFPEEAILSGPTQTRFDIHYQIDTGSGYGDWHNVYYQKAGGAGTSGQFTFTVTDATGVEIGDYIWGTGRTNIGKVTNKVGNTITSDVANTATVSGVIRFNHLPSEVVDPAIGFKMKFRLTVIVAETVACLFLRVATTSSAAAQGGNLYQLDSNTLSLTGVPTGCDLVVLSAGTSTILDQKDSVNSNTLTYIFSGAHNVDIGIIKPGYIPYYIRNLSLTEVDSAIPVSLTADRNYA